VINLALHLRSRGCVIVISAIDVYCMPTIEDISNVLLDVNQNNTGTNNSIEPPDVDDGGSGWVLKMRFPVETLGRPCEGAVFVRVPRTS